MGFYIWLMQDLVNYLNYSVDFTPGWHSAPITLSSLGAIVIGRSRTRKWRLSATRSTFFKGVKARRRSFSVDFLTFRDGSGHRTPAPSFPPNSHQWQLRPPRAQARGFTVSAPNWRMKSAKFYTNPPSILSIFTPLVYQTSMRPLSFFDENKTKPVAQILRDNLVRNHLNISGKLNNYISISA